MTDAQLWLAAIEIGAFFSLIALGMYLVVVGADFFNFAMGPYAMAAAMASSWVAINYGLALWIAMPLGIAVAVALSILTEKLVVKQVQKRSGRGELPALVAVTAVLFGIQQLAGTVFGRTPLPGQKIFDFDPISVLGATVDSSTVVLVVGTALIFVGIGLWLNRSTSGRLLRAVGDSPDAARVLGLPVDRVRLIAFTLAGVIAAVAGLLFAPKAGVQFTSGLSWTLTAFIALVIGGTGRSWAPLIGGMVLGVVQVFAPYYFGASAAQTAILLDCPGVLRFPSGRLALEEGSRLMASLSTSPLTSNPPATSGRSRTRMLALSREALITVVVVAAVLLWMGPSLYRQDLVFLAATYSLIALGMYVPFVLAGSLSMAYSAYAAIGAYAVALISVRTGLSMWWGWILGALAAAAVAVLLSLATQKLSGFYLAAVTLLFGIAFEHWLIDGPSFTGGSAGISGVETVTMFGWEPPRYVLVVFAILFVCLIAVAVDRLRKSVWGLMLQAARDNRNVARSSGVNPAHLTVVALAIGAAIASTGGSLFTVSVQAVTPETFTLSIVFLAIFMPIIGGRSSAWGAPLGALIVVIVTLNMPGYQGSGELLLAGAVLVILIVAPGGVIGWSQNVLGRMNRLYKERGNR